MGRCVMADRILGFPQLKAEGTEVLADEGCGLTMDEARRLDAELREIERIAKEIYAAEGYQFFCLPTDEAWEADRKEVRDRFLQRARMLRGKVK